MKENLEQCLKWILESEGGYVNHPKDPGGATNQGITQRTYNSYRRLHKKGEQDVKDITQEEIKEIYQKYYMAPIYFDKLPAGIDYSMLDYSVNSGPYRAIKTAQKLVKTAKDGIMGPVTLKAIQDLEDKLWNQFDPRKFVVLYNRYRLEFLKGLKSFKDFGKGWGNRLDKVEKNSIKLIEDNETNK